MTINCNISDQLRSILDGVYSIAGQLGLHSYSVNVVQVTWTGDRPGIGTKTVNEFPLLIAGMQNPAIVAVKNSKDQDLILSADTYKDVDFIIGPITLPYTTANCVGGNGFPISIFDPPTNTPTASPYQLYFHMFGPALNPNGDYFEKVSTEVVDGGSLTYKILVRNIAITP